MKSRYLCHLVGILKVLVRGCAWHGFSAACHEPARCPAGCGGPARRGRVRSRAWGVGADRVPASGPNPRRRPLAGTVTATEDQPTGDSTGAGHVDLQATHRTRPGPRGRLHPRRADRPARHREPGVDGAVTLDDQPGPGPPRPARAEPGETTA